MSAEIDTLHRPFMEFLRIAGIPYVRARSDMESTIALGHPDFTLLCGHHALMIEFKTKGGKLTADQEERIAELRAAGNFVHVLRDLAQAIDITLQWQATLAAQIATRTERATLAAEPKQDLRRFGGTVMRVERDGSFSRVRAATADDALLPVLV